VPTAGQAGEVGTVEAGLRLALDGLADHLRNALDLFPRRREDDADAEGDSALREVSTPYAGRIPIRPRPLRFTCSMARSA
jgi:hypothetical protein